MEKRIKKRYVKGRKKSNKTYAERKKKRKTCV